ncbi:Spore wall protein 7 [Astathelohania contejeani]|uniref:Spore wall protein 7 n=1 Tax=Astathelohania contejeani TaxID=164912 RepID=A0ABQ7I035_9MICR|nr:Spore wall protein 7 [Thelohania contejeani]
MFFKLGILLCYLCAGGCSRKLGTENIIPCTRENKTYTIDINIHLQKNVIDSLHSILKRRVNANITEEEAVVEYFGTIIDELNDFLKLYRVQLHLLLSSYNIDDFMGGVVGDYSCEVTKPVIERTSAAFSKLKNLHPNDIGFHLFVWGCIFVNGQDDIKTLYNNLKCGRVGGVLWFGSEETRSLIKNTILHGITGVDYDFSKGGVFGNEIAGKMCSYVTSCVGMDESELGQIVYGTDVLSYTEDEGTSSDESHLH